MTTFKCNCVPLFAGAQYSAQLEMESTTLLVANATESAKYKSAQRWKIPVVIPDFIYDSVQAGYFLDTSRYIVNRGSSTPTKTKSKSTLCIKYDVTECAAEKLC